MPQRLRRSPGVRANDLDRSIVGTMLDTAYAEGELDAGEHSDRLAAALKAKTHGELIALVADLQAELPEFAREPAEPITPIHKDRSAMWIAIALLGGITVITGGVGLILYFAFSASSSAGTSSDAPQQVISTRTINQQLVVTNETLINSFGVNFETEMGHRPTRVDCPGDLDAEPGNAMHCTVFDGDASYPGIATVISVHGTDIRLNTNIDQLPMPQ